MKDHYDFSKGTRGPVIPSPGKTKITIRIDDEILEFFRQEGTRMGGASYQGLINHALRAFMEGRKAAEVVREVTREVVREELAHDRKLRYAREKRAKKS